MSHKMMTQVDMNNLKALGIVSLAIHALENGCDDFNLVDILEVVRDYLTANNNMFDGIV